MFSVIIPLFNEDENIQSLFDEILHSLKKYNNYEIVLVNDASTDNTLDVIYKIKNKNTLVVNNKKNEGQSYSIHKGIQNASNDIIITIDGDGQNDPSDISNLLEYYLSSSETKLVGGLRKNRKDNFIKIISSKIANYIREKLLKDDCLDTGCSLKVFDKNIFLSFPYFNGIHRFLPALFKGYGYKTKFIYVNHRKRKFGNSKYGTISRLFRGIRDIIKVNKIIKANK